MPQKSSTTGRCQLVRRSCHRTLNIILSSPNEPFRRRQSAEHDTVTNQPTQRNAPDSSIRSYFCWEEPSCFVETKVHPPSKTVHATSRSLKRTIARSGPVNTLRNSFEEQVSEEQLHRRLAYFCSFFESTISVALSWGRSLLIEFWWWVLVYQYASWCC